ncbi:MAG TPA: branched-chain amino acid ABC transporter permease [Candidatus Paceibacterota bacterium]|jgi:branched-chain amino acid transport system permease protein|nr:branched-chain amino acid ABC transporter permease [Candidatus Paceibacterota bacterium]
MEYIFQVLILVCIYGTLALAQNLVMGATGLLTIAGAAFYGIGAYVAAILATKFGFSIFTALIVAPLVAGLIALVIGSTFARFRDDYFMLATLGFLMIFNTVARNWESVTGGSYGIAAIPKPHIFGFVFDTPFSFLFLAIAVLLFVAAITYLISRSSFGRVLNAIREDEDALSVFGYKTSRYKLIAFAIGAALTSLGGVLFASYLTFIDSNLFTVDVSILLWAMIILGGIGRNRGALVGALLLITLPEALRFIHFPDQVIGLMRQCIYGLLLVFLMLYRPKGILGQYKL